ncbi:MAG: nucleotide exchange factor GrpE [Planctomycetota bacterium]|nr:nucleotide exchange factor GrpE [Planctomycetota bacterium]
MNGPKEKRPGKGNSSDDGNHAAAQDAESATAESPSSEQDALRQERDQLADQLKRTLADMANMRRRAVKEAEDSRRLIVEGFTHELLPVLDNFQLALQSVDAQADTFDAQAFLDGIKMVQTLLTSALERHGLAPIEAQGQAFDPAKHEAMAVEPRDDVPEGQIIRVMQDGYMLGDRVLRHAKVIVAGNPPADADNNPGS